jgi:hypothetical protein
MTTCGGGGGDKEEGGLFVTANWRTKPRGKYLIFFFPVSMECSGYVQKSYQGRPKKGMIKKLTDPTGEKRGKFCRIALVPKIKKIRP